MIHWQSTAWRQGNAKPHACEFEVAFLRGALAVAWFNAGVAVSATGSLAPEVRMVVASFRERDRFIDGDMLRAIGEAIFPTFSR